MKKSKSIIKKIYKQLESKPESYYHAKDEMPMPNELLEALKEEYPIGTKITLMLGNGNQLAEVVGYNMCCYGFYPGIRYPIMAKRVSDGLIFEYGLEQIKYLKGDNHGIKSAKVY